MTFDSSRAREELGLRPRPARTALREAIRWLQAEGRIERSLPNGSAPVWAGPVIS
jgi:DNA-binding GntR family transcriptional regulator